MIWLWLKNVPYQDKKDDVPEEASFPRGLTAKEAKKKGKSKPAKGKGKSGGKSTGKAGTKSGGKKKRK